MVMILFDCELVPGDLHKRTIFFFFFFCKNPNTYKTSLDYLATMFVEAITMKCRMEPGKYSST